MNGNLFEEIKKNGDNKKRDKVKNLVLLFITNFVVATLCLSIKSPRENSPSPVRELKTHPHFKMMVLPLKQLAEINPQDTETIVSLIDKNKKIVTAKAYLHEEVKDKDKDKDSDNRTNHFKIEISEDDILKMSAGDADPLMAIPEVNSTNGKLSIIKKRVSPYEINF